MCCFLGSTRPLPSHLLLHIVKYVHIFFIDRSACAGSDTRLEAQVFEEGAEQVSIPLSAITLMWRCFPEPCFPGIQDVLRRAASMQGTVVIPANLMLPGTYVMQVGYFPPLHLSVAYDSMC